MSDDFKTLEDPTLTTKVKWSGSVLDLAEIGDFDDDFDTDFF